MKARFDTCEYEFNHGAKPRGRGSWAFVDAKHANANNYLDFVFWTSSGLTFSEAKKVAAAHFAQVDGFSGDIVVCS